MKKTIYLFLAVLLLQTTLLVSAAEQPLDVTLTFENDNVHIGNTITVVVTALNTGSQNLQLSKILIHMPWYQNSVFVIQDENTLISPQETAKISIALAVPAYLDTSFNVSDTSVIVDYRLNGETLGSGIIRPAKEFTLTAGKNIYSLQKISSEHVAFLTIVYLLIAFSLQSDTVLKKLNGASIKRISTIILLLVFMVNVTSVLFNYAPWIKDPMLQGFTLTGDEPHYLISIENILKLNLDPSVTYPQDAVRHFVNATGLLMNGQAVSSHPYGTSILLTPAYYVFKHLFGSGALGASIFMSLLYAILAVYIFKGTTIITNEKSIGTMIAFTFAFGTQLFAWSNQINSEAILPVLIFIAVYYTIQPSTRSLKITGALMGILPLFKVQTIFITLAVSAAIFMFSKRNMIKSYLTGLTTLILPIASIILITAPHAIIGVVSFGMPQELGITILGLTINKFFLEAMIGLFVDPAFGILVLSPVILLAFLGISEFTQLRKIESLFVYSTFAAFMSWFIGTSLSTYWSGWLCIPGKYMNIVFPLLAYPLAMSFKLFWSSFKYRTTYYSLMYAGIVLSGSVALNRALGYTIRFVNSQPKSWLVLCISEMSKLPFDRLPDFAYTFLRPENQRGVLSYAIVFILIATILMYLGHKKSEYDTPLSDFEY